jgi:UPF0042 nucleotide-binding protein
MLNYKADPLKQNLVIVTGLSGSGKSVAIKTLEDLGYYCIDNLPITLFDSFYDLLKEKKLKFNHIALAIDARGLKTPQLFEKFYMKLKEVCNLYVLFLETQKDILLKRYKETRRSHPLFFLNDFSELNLENAIDKDFQLMELMRPFSSDIVNTSDLSHKDLRRILFKEFSKWHSEGVTLSLISFGYKFGLPPDLDIVFDLRSFKNPYYEESLKYFSGEDKAVIDYVMSDENVVVLIDKVLDFLKFMHKSCLQEGRRYLSVGMGCTGGQHRSVVVVQNLSQCLKPFFKTVSIEHRHKEKWILKKEYT